MTEPTKAKPPLFSSLSAVYVVFSGLSALLLFLLTFTNSITVFSWLSLTVVNTLSLFAFFVTSVAPTSFTGLKGALGRIKARIKEKNDSL